MKKLVILAFTILALMNSLLSCSQEGEELPDNLFEHSIESDVFVTDIVDISGVGGAESDVEEKFFEDETHVYIFGNPKSDYLLVEYSDGSNENLKDSLKSGRCKISDLDKFGINYYAESKTIESIVDIVERDNLVTASAIEPFFEDEEYVYSFSSIRSHYVIVTFKDGTQKNIKEALSDGSAKICDLDWFGISYYKDIK